MGLWGLKNLDEPTSLQKMRTARSSMAHKFNWCFFKGIFFFRSVQQFNSNWLSVKPAGPPVLLGWWWFNGLDGVEWAHLAAMIKCSPYVRYALEKFYIYKRPLPSAGLVINFGVLEGVDGI